MIVGLTVLGDPQERLSESEIHNEQKGQENLHVPNDSADHSNQVTYNDRDRVASNHLPVSLKILRK